MESKELTEEQLNETIRILHLVKSERQKQHKKFGEQNHQPNDWIAILTEEVGEAAKEAVDFKWSDNDKIACIERLRSELIQVAAVAVQAVECLDRNMEIETVSSNKS